MQFPVPAMKRVVQFEYMTLNVTVQECPCKLQQNVNVFNNDSCIGDSF